MNVYACGCIPFQHTRDREPLALMILRTGGFWEFPKGKQEAGETDEETALRELYEETGLNGELTDELPLEISYTFTRDDTQIEKKVRYFFCRVPDGSVVQTENREVNDHAWLPLEDLMDRATYPEMKDLARKVLLALAD